MENQGEEGIKCPPVYILAQKQVSHWRRGIRGNNVVDVLRILLDSVCFFYLTIPCSISERYANSFTKIFFR